MVAASAWSCGPPPCVCCSIAHQILPAWREAADVDLRYIQLLNLQRITCIVSTKRTDGGCAGFTCQKSGTANTCGSTVVVIGGIMGAALFTLLVGHIDWKRRLLWHVCKQHGAEGGKSCAA